MTGLSSPFDGGDGVVMVMVMVMVTLAVRGDDDDCQCGNVVCGRRAEVLDLELRLGDRRTATPAPSPAVA